MTLQEEFAAVTGAKLAPMRGHDAPERAPMTREQNAIVARKFWNIVGADMTHEEREEIIRIATNGS